MSIDILHPDNIFAKESYLETCSRSRKKLYIVYATERLRGGAGDLLDDGDDEFYLDDDEVGPSSGKRPVIELPPEKLIKRMLHIFKIGILVVMWILFTYFLMTVGERSDARNIVTIPASETKDFKMPPLNPPKDRLGVSITGPFMDEDDLMMTVGEVNPNLTTRVRRVYYDASGANIVESIPISVDWVLQIDETLDLTKASAMVKHYVFHLNKDASATNPGPGVLHLDLVNNVKNEVTLTLRFQEQPVDKSMGIFYGGLVLLFLYVMIIWEFINRTLAAVIASTMAIGLLAFFENRPSMITIVSWIDVETMMLLFGMMTLVAILSESGIFDYSAVLAYKLTKGHIWPLINCLCAFTVVLSAFLDNVTMMLLVTPVVIRLCEATALNPVPILMCMVIFSNIGAAITPVGDPPNVIISTNHFIAAHDVNFGMFCLHMLPGVTLAMIQTYCQLRFKYRNIADLRYKDSSEVEDLKMEIDVWERAAANVNEESVREAMTKKAKRLKEGLADRLAASKSTRSVKSEPAQDYEETLKMLITSYPIRSKRLLIKSGIAFSFVVILFFSHSLPHLHNLTLGWVSFLGALLLIILANIDEIEAVLTRLEWSTLLFFASLLILMECLAELGLIELIGNFVVNMIMLVGPDTRLTLALLIIIWVSGMASAFLDNIPVSTMMVKIIITLSQNKALGLPLHPLVWALAFGCCFGGNGTIIGASANVVSAGVAEQHGYKFGFVGFFRVGFPVTLGSLLMATIYLVVAHSVIGWQ